MVMMKYTFCVALFFVLSSCGGSSEDKKNEDDTVAIAPLDSATQAQNLVANDRSQIKDTVFHTSLPPVFDGDIIMQNCTLPQAETITTLIGGKYNNVGLIFQRDRDGLLMVLEVLDSLRMTPLTDFVDRSTKGQVCLLRVKDANRIMTEKKTTALRNAAKAYKKKPFDGVLNWDDSHLYSSEFVWKVYNNAMTLKLCPTRAVKDFDISGDKKKQLEKKYGGEVSDRDEAVSIDDIYNSPKLEIIYEK